MTPPGFLESRAAVTDLVHRYALNVRNRTPSASAKLFADNIVFEVREIDFADPAAQPRIRTRAEGKEAVLAHIGKSASGNVRVCPIIGNLLIDFDGDVARGNCLMSSRTWPSGTEVFGEYEDEFVFDGERWLFRSRLYTIFLAAAR